MSGDEGGGTLEELQAELTRIGRERKELFARLARLEAERTGQAMELFTMAAHELRSPLQALIMTNDLLVERVAGSADETPREWLLAHLHAQLTALDRLHALIDTWSAAPMLRAGELATTPQLFDLADLVRDLVGRHANDLSWAGCPLDLRLQPVVGAWDRKRVETAVTSLITNAMKYGARRPIAITLDADDHAATLIVRDGGPGIAPADQERIFHRFERAVSRVHFGGLGLGLWMARGLLRAMGGSITVESTPGQGATFVIRLPRPA